MSRLKGSPISGYSRVIFYRENMHVIQPTAVSQWEKRDVFVPVEKTASPKIFLHRSPFVRIVMEIDISRTLFFLTPFFSDDGAFSFGSLLKLLARLPPLSGNNLSKLFSGLRKCDEKDNVVKRKRVCSGNFRKNVLYKGKCLERVWYWPCEVYVRGIFKFCCCRIRLMYQNYNKSIIGKI